MITHIRIEGLAQLKEAVQRAIREQRGATGINRDVLSDFDWDGAAEAARHIPDQPLVELLDDDEDVPEAVRMPLVIAQQERRDGLFVQLSDGGIWSAPLDQVRSVLCESGETMLTAALFAGHPGLFRFVERTRPTAARSSPRR